MLFPNESILKPLQRKCWLALSLYTDLAEATCALMIAAKNAPISEEDRAKLTRLRRDENAAQAAYMKARMELMVALSVDSKSADRSEWSVLSANP
jgi:hypothetical protein